MPSFSTLSAWRSSAGLSLCVAFATVALPGGLTAAPSIEFELITEPGFPLGAAQQWVELFSRLGETSIRIRQAQSGERESVANLGTEKQPIFHVIGSLTSRNRLILPGGEFGTSDRSRIGDWIKKLREGGVSGPTAKTGSFGLTDEQLVAFHDQLAVRISCATRGRRAGDVARDIIRGGSLEFTVSDAAREAFKGSDVCDDDLQQLTCGTALAAVVRPLGLVIRPEREKVPGGKVRLLVCGVNETKEGWPVGWPLQEIPAKVAPKLFEYLKVTITNQPFPDAVAAIQQRVEMPFLMDYNSLARKQIDPAKVRVSYTKDRETYHTILRNLFYQAKLTSDLRVDEAGQPFLWISAR